ncbi:MAG: serine/threonine protein kinase [Verrucomicrobia bacterium]|nr:serine/threonine protein kinase [Verrucomicrobiota bacterium]
MKTTFLILLTFLAASVHAANWPAWRGDAAGSGITTETNLPLKWSDTENIRWRVPLPERGNSTPVVWGDRVFITQAVTPEKRRTVMCFHRADGRLLWQQGVVYDKPERSHKTNPYCSASAVTDGERVIASFGSAGVVCYDMNGRELWRRDLGPLDNIWGNASSPVLHGNLCIHYHGPGENTFLAALDKTTGKTVWKFDEPVWNTAGRTDGFEGKTNGVVGTWSTPIIVGGELIMSFPMEIIAFDPSTGKIRWRCEGLNPLVYTSPIAGDGVIVAMGGFRGNTVAVKATKQLWHQVRAKGGIGSGVIKDGRIYFPTSPIACLDLATGNTLWDEKIPGAKGSSWSSVLLSGDRLYLPLQSGDVVVVKASPKFEVLAVNSLKEKSNSSLAASNGELFFRTEQTLWCISAGKSSPPTR